MYQVLKLLIGWGLRLYYREICVTNKSAFHKKGPTIIIANHPNTLMDAWLIALYARKDLYFLTKGTFFNSPVKRWLLRRLNMIPINRNVEERTSGVNNQDSFEACYEVLRQGKCLVIFPEGNSVMERMIREFKTGTARIALHTEVGSQNQLNIQILPLAFFYSQGESFRSAVHMELGKPISVIDFVAAYETNKQQAIRSLNATMQESLTHLLFNITSKEEEALLEELAWIQYLNTPGKKVRQLFHEYQELHKRIQFLMQHKASIEWIRHALNQIQLKKKKIRFKSPLLHAQENSRKHPLRLVLRLSSLIASLPLLLFGFVHSILAFKLTGLLVPKIVANKEFYAPVAVLLGLFLYPVNYGIFCWLLTFFLENKIVLTIAYFCSMPLSGMLSFYLVHSWRVTLSDLRVFILKKNDRKTLLELQKDIRDLRTHLDALTQH